jgi:hypothetical protein
MTCCTLHNFIGTHNPNDQIFNVTDATELGMSEQPYAYGNDDEAGPSHSGQYDFSSEAGVEWPILEKALHKQCGIMHMETKMEIIKKMAIIMLK